MIARASWLALGLLAAALCASLATARPNPPSSGAATTVIAMQTQIEADKSCKVLKYDLATKNITQLAADTHIPGDWDWVSSAVVCGEVYAAVYADPVSGLFGIGTVDLRKSNTMTFSPTTRLPHMLACDDSAPAGQSLITVMSQPGSPRAIFSARRFNISSGAEEALASFPDTGAYDGWDSAFAYSNGYVFGASFEASLSEENHGIAFAVDIKSNTSTTYKEGLLGAKRAIYVLGTPQMSGGNFVFKGVVDPDPNQGDHLAVATITLAQGGKLQFTSGGAQVHDSMWGAGQPAPQCGDSFYAPTVGTGSGKVINKVSTDGRSVTPLDFSAMAKDDGGMGAVACF